MGRKQFGLTTALWSLAILSVFFAAFGYLTFTFKIEPWGIGFLAFVIIAILVRQFIGGLR